MSIFHLLYLAWAFWWGSYYVVLGGACRPYQYVQQMNRQFEQRTDRFWEYIEEADKWVEVKLPYDLLSCINGECTKVGEIVEVGPAEDKMEGLDRHHEALHVNQRKGMEKNESGLAEGESSHVVLPQRKRISLTKMSETSIWITGQSGSIYERFWNELHWVIAPHDLPMAAGPGISVFFVNQTILALSEAGILYQMQLSESSRPQWVEFTLAINQSIDHKEQNIMVSIKSGVVSHDGLRAYFNTNSGILLELQQVDPPRWMNHRRPAGADVAAIADVDYIRQVVYTISSTGDLYEYDSNSKPSWKKHIWKEGTAQITSLSPVKGCMMHGIYGDHSISLFLLTKDGDLVERQLQQRKWNWILHGSPEEHNLTSITPFSQDESSENHKPLFLTTSIGSVIEYQVRKQLGISNRKPFAEAWTNHLYPLNAKVAKGTQGLHLLPGRIFFPLDDGRLAELHLPGIGGDSSGPSSTVNLRRRSSAKYVWSVLDAPESEGWNAEYCTEARGPTNCITGTKDEPNGMESTRLVSRKRKENIAAQDYLPLGSADSETIESVEGDSPPDNRINSDFRLRLMHERRSFFLVSDAGLTFEYLYTENIWLWLRHESSTAMKGVVGNYNGSLFLVDTYGCLFIRERSENQLSWMNCSSLRKGRISVVGGAPWDGIPGQPRRVTPEDALFFVSKSGRLLQFSVSMRKFEWKDCGKPQKTKVASIVDQELFRENIVFVTGENGRLYQYNKVSELWHEHHQSQHLVLSKVPGTAMRPSPSSLTASLFTLSEEGGLVEYHWDAFDGWNWVEHGTPYKGVSLVGSPGPSFKGNQLFLIGSDGKVYMRYMDQNAWKWKACGFPGMNGEPLEQGIKDGKAEVCVDKDFGSSDHQNQLNHNDLNTDCDPKVASTRPIPFSEDSLVFELRDGRLAEMQCVEDTEWVWSRIIATPASLCLSNYWTAIAS